MRMVFFGSPETALPSLQKLLDMDYRIELVITQPDSPAGRGKKVKESPVKKFALAHSIPVYQPVKIRKDTNALDIIKKIAPDINVVVAYGQIIPSSIIYAPLFNSVNVHFSLLPKYRGAAPVQAALLNGEKTTGITIFELNEKMDEGDILNQRKVDLFSEENALELEARMAEIGAELLVQTLLNIAEIKKIPQDHSIATYAPLLKKEDGKIDWSKDAQKIENHVRAFNPWPSAFTFSLGQRMKIIKGKRITTRSEHIQPGRIISIQKNGIEIGCGFNSVFLVKELQPENKKAMSAYSYSLGVQIDTGDRFE